MKVLLVLGAALLLAVPAVGQEQASFSQWRPANATGEAVTLRGQIHRPQGAGPFPGIVLQHGCGGVRTNVVEWAQFLSQNGYVVLVVEGFAARGIQETCTGTATVTLTERARDSYGALAFLARQPYVDRARIAAMGISHGAGTQLWALFRDFAATLPADHPRFKIGALFYPPCGDVPAINLRMQNRPLSAPVQIFIGDKDDWTPAAQCQELASQAQARGERVTVKTYPDAYHSFDDLTQPVTRLNTVVNSNSPTGRGATVGGNRAARDAARVDLLAFLKESL